MASILVSGLGSLAPMPASCVSERVRQIFLAMLETCLAWPSVGCSMAKEDHTRYFLRAGGLGSPDWPWSDSPASQWEFSGCLIRWKSDLLA